MKAMVLNELGEMKSNPYSPLSLQQIPEPTPGEGEVLIKVAACGVCHTELDEIEGRTPPPELPVILGHQVVGVVEEVDCTCPNGRCQESRDYEITKSRRARRRGVDLLGLRRM